MGRRSEPASMASYESWRAAGRAGLAAERRSDDSGPKGPSRALLGADQLVVESSASP